jgi:cyanophycinase
MGKYLFLLLLFVSLKLNGQIVGPENGTLIIVGGGKLSDTILLAFIEASGGMEAPILVIPTALGQPNYTENEGDFLRKLGAKNVKVWHTYDKLVANTDSFCKSN